MNEDRGEFRFIPGREMRVIPKGWQHPKDARGKYVPLLPAGYAFDEGESAPTMPEITGETEIAAYETVSEGTPISPAFPNTPEGRLALVNHCAEHATTFGDSRADAEGWAAILFGETYVDLNGTVRSNA